MKETQRRVYRSRPSPRRWWCRDWRAPKNDPFRNDSHDDGAGARVWPLSLGARGRAASRSCDVKAPRKFPHARAMISLRCPDPSLEEAAVNAKYAFSEYHQCGPTGPKAKKRTKPASHCPRQWTKQEALNAIRQAIRSGDVSVKRTSEGFPRFVWHREGDTWYVARTQDRADGVYHGYPIEEAELPYGLRNR